MNLGNQSYLNLSQRNLSVLPEIPKNTSYATVNLSFNHFTSIPSELKEIQSIDSLDMRGNLISSLTSRDIPSLRGVSKIDLDWGKLMQDISKTHTQDYSSGVSRSQSNPLKHQSKRSFQLYSTNRIGNNSSRSNTSEIQSSSKFLRFHERKESVISNLVPALEDDEQHPIAT